MVLLVIVNELLEPVLNISFYILIQAEAIFNGIGPGIVWGISWPRSNVLIPKGFCSTLEWRRAEGILYILHHFHASMR
jgi:hypothetical protein